jgi:hypothetical protein
VEVVVQDLLQTGDNDSPPKRTGEHELQKSINSLRPRKAFQIHGIPKDCLRLLPKKNIHTYNTHDLSPYSTHLGRK